MYPELPGNRLLFRQPKGSWETKMASQMAAVLRYIGQLASICEGADEADSTLIQQFVAERSENAFATIIHRHGPLVLRACRQVLDNQEDAEDAFQATFIVLARKAASIRKRVSLAAWLHRVAVNISWSAKASTARRRSQERQADHMSELKPAANRNVDDQAAFCELQPIIHEEVDRLPEKYRVPVVLCYLEGKTHYDAARQLDWPLGTVKGRLARARGLLRTRLARRGVVLSAAGLAAALTENGAVAGIPPALFASSLHAAVAFATGGSIVAGTASAQAVTLAKGALQTMFATRLLYGLALLCVIGMMGFGAALGFGLGGERAGPPPAADGSVVARGEEPRVPAAADSEKQVKVKIPGKEDQKPEDAVKDELKRLEGTWHMVACEEGGQPLPQVNPADFFDFTGTKFHFKSGLRRVGGTFTIDPSKNPKWMDQIYDYGGGEQKVFKGIYDLKGDKLRLFMGLPGGERPTEFKTKEGEKLWLRTFERVKPPGKPPAPKAAEKEKDKSALWPPRLLGAAEVPLPDRIVQSDIVVVGRVVALAPKDVEAVFSSENPYNLDYRIAVLKVQEVIHGQKDVKEVRLGFISPDQDRKVDKTGKAMPPLWPLEFQPVKVGQEGMFFLRKHHHGNFYVNFVLFGGFLASNDPPEFTKYLENARRLNKVLTLPLEALKAENASNRFLAATMLVTGYRLSWLKDRKLPEKAIDADESKLILKTLAEADWSDSTEAFCPSKYPSHPYQVFLQLGVTKADGYDPPIKAPDSQDILRYTQNWLRDNQEKYRIQRFTSSK
jgi:RNA polymerase sigma-70 factor (ECF subfamily)